MNKEMDHVSPWLGAYLDGELSSSLHEQVDTHLQDCPACQSELIELRALVSLLQADPIPALRSSDEVFAAQVLVRLPGPARPFWQNILLWSWNYAPLGLFGAWAFFQAVVWVSRVLLVLLEYSPTVAQSMEALLPFASGGPAIVPGLLSMDLLNALLGRPELELPFVDLVSPLAGLELLVVVVLSALFVSWLASWWVYNRQHQNT
jgi:hypothetical protein